MKRGGDLPELLMALAASALAAAGMAGIVVLAAMLASAVGGLLASWAGAAP